MTDPVETVVCEPDLNAERLPDSPGETPVHRSEFEPSDFLDDSWAIEFDRRLAVWLAETQTVGG